MVKKIDVDNKPFTEAEAYKFDTKYYFRKDDESTKINSSIGKKDKKVTFSKNVKTIAGVEGSNKQLVQNKLLTRFTLPLTKVDPIKMPNPSLKGFVQPKRK
jgi:hypothetical protein